MEPMVGETSRPAVVVYMRHPSDLGDLGPTSCEQVPLKYLGLGESVIPTISPGSATGSVDWFSLHAR